MSQDKKSRPKPKNNASASDVNNKSISGLNLFGQTKYNNAGSKRSLRNILGNTDVDTDTIINPNTITSKPIESINRISSPSNFNSIPLPVGFQIFEYRIDSLLSQSNFGISYLATDLNLNYKVAIKEYLPTAIATRSSNLDIIPLTPNNQEIYRFGLEKFLIEARVLATFRLNSVVRVNRFFESQGSAYMVIGYEECELLKTWWPAHANMDEVEILTIFLPLLDGLSTVHETNYLHLNIKPESIYVRKQDNSLVLIDFCAAQRAMEMEYPDLIVSDEDFEQSNYYHDYPPSNTSSLDTEDPNQIDMSALNPSSDIYGLAATLYWMITGSNVPSVPNPQNQSQKNVNFTELTNQLSYKYSQDFLRAIQWALEVDPQKRPQNINQWQNALFSGNVGALDLKEALLTQNLSDRENLTTKKLQPGKSAQIKNTITRSWYKFKKIKNWSLSVKVAIIMIMVSLIPIVGTAYYNLRSSTSTIANSELRNLELISQGLSGRINQLMIDTDRLVDFLRHETELINFFKHKDFSQAILIQESIELLADANPDITPVIVMDQQGNALFSDNPGVAGKNFGFREYFRTAIKGQGYISGIVVGATAGTAGVYFARPIQENNTIYGVLVVRLQAETFTDILQNVRSQNLIPILIDEHGVILYYPDQQYLYSSLMPLPAEILQEIREDRRFRRENINSVNSEILATSMINTKTSGNVSYLSPFTQKQEIVGFAPVGINNWVVGVSKSREDFEALFDQQFKQVLLSVTFVSILIILASIKFGRSIAGPIQQLINATHKLQEGNYEKAIVPTKSTDEVGRLARTFNIMIDILRQRERENKLKLDPLSKKHDSDPLGLND